MIKENILLHICCAPCLIYPLKQLRSQGYSVSGFFYNPNIFPQEEYQLRKKTLIDYSQRAEISVNFSSEERNIDFLKEVSTNVDRPARCQKCWYLRLKKTAEQALKMNIPAFTTTLLVSPYQDTELLKAEGERAAKETGVNFYFYDFREGYQEAVRIAKEEKLYRQKYCGCSFSLEEKRKHESIRSVR